MFKKKSMKKFSKGFVSVLLVLAVMLSLAVPFNIAVFAEEAAEGSNICAYLRYIDPNKSGTKEQYNLELVFAKKGNTPSGTIYKSYTNVNFADTEYVKTTYNFTDYGPIKATFNYETWGSFDKIPKAQCTPWYYDSNTNNNIRKVTFQDKIAPKSIAGWFYHAQYLYKVEGLENLDTSKCENMTMAFWYCNTGYTTYYDENSNQTPNAYMKDLDLSSLDTSKVKKIDYFFYSSKLESLNISGFDLKGIDNNIADVGQNGKYGPYKGAVRDINYLVYGGLNKSLNVDGVDLSKVEYLRSFITNTNLATIDVSKVIGPSNAYGCDYAFQNNKKLTNLILGYDYEEDGQTKKHYFEVGITPTYLGVPRNGYDNPFTAADESQGGTVLVSSNNPFKSGSVWFGDLVSGCSSLKTIDLEYLKINLDGSYYTGADKAARGLEYGVNYQLNTVFKDCTSLEEIKNLNSLGFKSLGNGNWVTRGMFNNCGKLEKIDFSGYEGMLGGPDIFKDCGSLKELDISGMGMVLGTSRYKNDKWNQYFMYRRGYYSYNGSTKTNVFAGCTDLSKVTLGEYYFTDGKQYDSSNGDFTCYDALTYNNGSSSLPADIPPVGDDRIWKKVKSPSNYTKADPTKEDDKGNKLIEIDELTTYQLFAEYKPEYAGTWVRASKISLVAEGADIDRQTIDGAVDLPVSYDPSKIQTPVKNGYDFVGWYATDENGDEHNLAEQLAHNQDDDPTNDENIVAWTYYAKWNEHKYTLKLNGNGGTTSANATETEGQYETPEGKVVTSTTGSGEDFRATEFIADSSLGYSKFYELSNKLFSRNEYILSSWNTRPNGTGESFAANDSVNMLTEIDNGEATLYAQWHKPDVVIKFDPDYEGAPSLPDKYYTLKSGETTYYGELPEATAREGYTFLGWYTEKDGQGKKIVNKADEDLDSSKEQNKVSNSLTLYAYWEQNPTITFDANGGSSAIFDDDPDKTVISKYYQYGRYLGVLPTPQKGSAVLEGWFTEPSGGTRIDGSTTTATTNKTYYAHWGYKPQYETNGGVISPAVSYAIQESAEYTITTLPTISKENNTFDGWYFSGKKFKNGEWVTDDLPLENGVKLDLSEGYYIEAKWTPNDSYTVTLDFNDDNATPNKTIKVYSGGKIGQLPTPKKAGSTFLGWYNGGTKYTYDSTISGNITLTAQWAANNCEVTFDPNGGTLYDNADAKKYVPAGMNIPRIPGANRAEYVFDGWYTDIEDPSTKLTSSTVISSNVTYKAKWTHVDTLFTQGPNQLYKYSATWKTPSNEYATNIDDTLILAPSNGNSDLSVMLRVRFITDLTKISTCGTLPVGTVEIRVPKYVFQDASGAGIGTTNLLTGWNSSITNFAPSDPGSQYDYYIISNITEIIASTKFADEIFDITYSVSPAQLREINGGWIDESGYFAGEFYKRDKTTNPIEVKVLVDQDSDNTYETDYKKDLGLETHTKVNSSASKIQANASFGWDTSWGNKPDDADQYFYIAWTLKSSHEKSSSQKFKISWSEATAHDGTVVYMDEQSSEWRNADRKYETKVVTKHPRKVTDSGWKNVTNEAILTVEWLSGYKEQIRVSQTAGAYLLPQGQPQLFEKFYENWDIPEANPTRFINGGQEPIIAGEKVSNIPFDITYYEYKNVSNPTWNDGTKTYTTSRRNIVITDGEKGDVVLSTVKDPGKYDWDDSENSKNRVLSDSDYSFDYITVFLTEYDAVQISREENGETVKEWSEPYTHTAFADYNDIEVWIRTEGDSEYRLFKTITAADLTATNDDENSYDKTRGISTASVVLPEKTAGFQIRHTSEFFTTKLFTKVNMSLNSSNKVRSYVKDDVKYGYNSLLLNNSHMDSTGRESEESKDTETGGGYISSYELTMGESTIYAGKNCISNSQDNQSRFTITGSTEEFPVVISGWGYNDSGNLKPIESGVFRDLLPYDFTVDKDKVFVQARLTNTTDRGISAYQYDAQNTNSQYQYLKIPEGYYSVEFTDNWQNSGRTLMTVRVNTPADVKASGYNVFYKMKTTIANISSNGTNQTNYVSFTDTTDGQSPPNYKGNSITALDSKISPYYSPLDNKFTAYASDTTKCILPSNSSTGFNSSVKTESDFQFDDQTVGLNTDYSYNVTFQNSTKSAKNLIIYDVIENSLTGAACEWEGTLQEVDISTLSGISTAGNANEFLSPVLYYCTKTGDLTQEDLDFTKSIWTTQKPSDLSGVKAIAIDCRKTTANNDFVLPADTGSIVYNIKMKSPVTYNKNDVYTYNVAYVKGLLGDDTTFDNKTITKVMLHYMDPLFHKTSFPDTGTAEVRKGVVNKSTIDYKLSITNPDNKVAIENIVVEDLLDENFVVNNTPKVQFGDEDPIDINLSGKIASYEVSESGNRTHFTATVNSLDAGKTITIILPATVNVDTSDPELDRDMDNTATITSYNGSSAEITSETTYHTVIDSTQASVKKVNAKGEGLAGATLEIYEVNSTNCDANGNLNFSNGNTPVPKTLYIGGQDVTEFTSTEDVITFDLQPGDYILHEKSVPAGKLPGTNTDIYKKAADIPFTVDIEGIIHVGDELVDYVEMVDEPVFKIVFHENKPVDNMAERNKEFKVVEPTDLKNNKVEHFYNIPEWAGDEYVFAGWYSSNNYKMYSKASDITKNVNSALDFDSMTFTNKATNSGDGNYHFYAKWIPVDSVAKDSKDYNLVSGNYRGFGVAGVQVRNPHMIDSNYDNSQKSGGLRFVTSVSENLITSIRGISKISGASEEFGVEYGYVVGTEANINTFIDHYDIKDTTKYKLQYNGQYVNGVDTRGLDANNRTAENDYRYITNVNCTSRVKDNSNGVVAEDHRNFDNYRLYTLVVTYDNASDNDKKEKVDARAYIRYYDGNGKLRVFYNDYKKNTYYGGCMCSFSQVSGMALQQDEEKWEQEHSIPD